MIATANHNRPLIRRAAMLTALVAVALATIAVGATSASADTFPGNTTSYFNTGTPGDNGTLTVSTFCDHSTHRGSVSLSFMTPNSATDGLWVHTRIWVKHHNSSWNRALLLDNRRTFKKTLVEQSGYFTGDFSINQPQTLVSGVTFRGANWNYYDVGVQYSVAAPGDPWSYIGFLVEDSYVFSNVYGNRVDPTGCML